MRSPAPALLPIFRSQHQALLLSWLFLHPDQEHTLTELAKRLGIPLTTVQREVQRLVVSDLLHDRSVGRARLVRANSNHRAAAALTRILEVTYGPETIIPEEFAITGACRVLIFGSWARRFHGESGPPPHDVDVLVIGDVARTDAYEAADRSADRLGIQVNPVIRSAAQWRAQTDALVTQIRAEPLLTVFESPELCLELSP